MSEYGTFKEFKKYLYELNPDIPFDYNGKSCNICIFSKERVLLTYGGELGDENDIICKSIEEALESRFFDGKNLEEIYPDIIF